MAADDDTPDPARIVRLARQALSSAEFRKKFHLLDFWGPAELYPPQLEFFAKGATHGQRLIRGGNQVGKSFGCALEDAWHLTGQYPSWWRGRRFKKPVRAWVVGPSLQSVRDGAQKQLTAKQGEFGSGTIPLTAFVGKPIMIPGGTGGIDTLSVAHQTDRKADGVSTLTFKSFEQGIAKLQSESVDLIWVDERCSEEVYSELLARTIATDGIILISYTPLKGGGELTYRFLNEPDPDRCDIRIDENDALHIPVERRERIERNLPEHERDARIRGIPTLGIARVFPYPLAQLMQTVNPNALPAWARWVVGIDFGISHPCAGALCAWTHDTEQFWVLDTFRASGLSLAEQARRIYDLCRGTRIPVAFPHDAMQREKGSGQTIALQLKAYGVPMMATHAKNKDGSILLEPTIIEMNEYMRLGKFTIANHCTELGEEILNYHRQEDWKIVPLREDLISAVRYAFMMRRHGRPLSECDSHSGWSGGNYYGGHTPRSREAQLARGADPEPWGA